MRKSLLSFAIMVLVAGFFFCSTASFGQGKDITQNREKMVQKKVVMIIAWRNFRDEELQIPKKILEENKIEVEVASSSTEPAVGMLGAIVKPDLLVNEVEVADYDAVIFVGGQGASFYWNEPVAHRIAREAVRQGKVLGAICIAPVTLANAGVLEGKKATVWPTESKKLIKKGALYTGKNVETDGNIITASGPQAAEEFGRKIVEVLFALSNP